MSDSFGALYVVVGITRSKVFFFVSFGVLTGRAEYVYIFGLNIQHILREALHFARAWCMHRGHAPAGRVSGLHVVFALQPVASPHDRGALCSPGGFATALGATLAME